MAKIESWYKQDLKKPVPIRRMETVFNQDALGHLFGVEVYSDGETVILAGSVTGYCLLADGTTVPVSGTRSANRASIVIPQTAYSVIGPITITVKLTEGSAITTLLAVVGMVSRSRTGQQVDPGSTITDWTNQISAQLQDVQTAADNLGSTLAAPFSTATAYTAGSYVVYNGNLYRFTNDHAAGDWSSSEVTQVKACNEISDLKSAFDDLDTKLYGNDIHIFSRIDLSNTSELSVEVYTGRNGNVGNSGVTAYPRNVQMQSSTGYNSYTFRVGSENMVLYCDPSSSKYFSISYLENPSNTSWATSGTTLLMLGTASQRLRTTDGNLPTRANPLTILAGSQVVVTVNTDGTPIIFVDETKKSDILAPQNLGSEYPFLSVEMHDTYLYYYIPTNSGKWLRYTFNHYTNQSTNADGWVQRNVALVSADKQTVIFPVITNGEWEMAVQLKDRPDFIGCQNHGSEVSTITHLFFDGIERTLTDGDTFDCAKIKVIQKSTMYDPNDETTIVGYHYKVHEMTTDGISIKQRIEWIADNTAMKSYVMMIPAVRGNDLTSEVLVTDRAYDDYRMILCDVGTTSFNPTSVSVQNYKGHVLCLFGTTSHIAIAGECNIKNPTESVFAFLSNAVYYNKWYYGYCGDDYEIHNGDVWEWESKYKITYSGS